MFFSYRYHFREVTKMVIEYQKKARVILCTKVPEPTLSMFSDTSFLKHCRYPINHSQHPTGEYTVQNDRSGNCKYLTPNSKNLSFPSCQGMYKK